MIATPYRESFVHRLLRLFAGAQATADGVPSEEPAERYARDLLARRGPMPAADLVREVRAWLAHHERAMGGGVADLGFWGDGLWQGQAERVVARVLAQHG